MVRARDLGIPFDGTPGRFNAITDVEGVEVGHTTLIRGEGRLEVGTGPVRTGVTAILPKGKRYEPVFASWFTLNGCGEMTGTQWLDESGFLESCVALTNTQSVGPVGRAVTAWSVQHFDLAREVNRDLFWFLPVVTETSDMVLNDIGGNHVSPEDVWAAIDSASGGPVAEGSVGGGTGMVCHQFKGGIGTSSRRVETDDQTYTLGVLVQANYGEREQLTIAGVPVGREIPDLKPVIHETWGVEPEGKPVEGSIIAILATDAPLLPHQLQRLAKRVSLGIARMGGIGQNSSGDIFLAFSTANEGAARRSGLAQVELMPNSKMNPLFEATVQATEEAITNALVAAETMTGINGNTVFALPHERVREILKKYNRLNQ